MWGVGRWMRYCVDDAWEVAAAAADCCSAIYLAWVPAWVGNC